MVGSILENNVVTISGKISTKWNSVMKYNRRFYSFVRNTRLSDHFDKIPVTVSEIDYSPRFRTRYLPGSRERFRSFNSITVFLGINLF